MCSFVFGLFFVFSTVQNYNIWKYPPNFLQNSENTANFAGETEYNSKTGFSDAFKQKIIPRR